MMVGTVGPISCWWQRYDTWTEHMFQLTADVEKLVNYKELPGQAVNIIRLLQ